MMCYIPLLIRQANDMEENSGPMIFDIIDPMVNGENAVGNVWQCHLLLLFIIKWNISVNGLLLL